MSGSSLPPFQVSSGREGFAGVCAALSAFKRAGSVFRRAGKRARLNAFAAKASFARIHTNGKDHPPPGRGQKIMANILHIISLSPGPPPIFVCMHVCLPRAVKLLNLPFDTAFTANQHPPNEKPTSQNN